MNNGDRIRIKCEDGSALSAVAFDEATGAPLKDVISVDLHIAAEGYLEAKILHESPALEVTARVTRITDQCPRCGFERRH